MKTETTVIDRPAMRAYGFANGQDLKPLPLPLRSDPYRWLASALPAEDRDDWWPALEYRLSLYLDPAGLDWLKALAVYPVLNWELTLYLGRGLYDATGSEFYAEPRLAAQLRRLPQREPADGLQLRRDALLCVLDQLLLLDERLAHAVLADGFVALVGDPRDEPIRFLTRGVVLRHRGLHPACKLEQGSVDALEFLEDFGARAPQPVRRRG